MANEAAWAARLARYKGPELKRSVWQLASAAALFGGAWVLMYASLRVGYWLTLLLAVPAAFFLIRLFIIQHDCGHAAFFRSTRTADIVGSILGVLTLTPYHYWKKTHALHHATSGNLEHRGFGDIDTLTVDEYLARSRWERFKYRVYRHPVVLFGVGAGPTTRRRCRGAHTTASPDCSSGPPGISGYTPSTICIPGSPTIASSRRWTTMPSCARSRR